MKHVLSTRQHHCISRTCESNNLLQWKKEVPEVSAIEATSPQLPYQQGEGSLVMDRAVPDLSAAIDDTPPQSTDEEVVNVDGFTDIVS